MIKRPWRKTGKIIKCNICKKEFYIRKFEFNKRKFCSHKCYWRNLIGKKTWNKGIKWKAMTGKNHPRFKGRGKNTQGYIWIYYPTHPFAMHKQYVYEHRFIVEQIIKRFLKPQEIVHHLNNKKDDNRPQNLIVFKHKKFHNSFHSGKDINLCNIIFDGRKYHN